ncbi:hypothetical protein BUE76_13665 [Cnuella takakiae]|nr:hypothetical protein BUE76_13665 [Cnuella takakiae]
MLLCCLLACSSVRIYGQALSVMDPTYRVKFLPTKPDRLKLDSLWLVPGSLQVGGVADSFYILDPFTATLRWKQKPPADSVLIQYHVWNTKLGTIQKRHSYDSLLDQTLVGSPALAKAEKQQRDWGKLRYSGSFERGLSMGNAQSAALQSNFNLQLEGWLPDSTAIQAALSDNNLPLQPDGTTRQLNEWDQVYLRFQKKNWDLQLGDQDLKADQLYFLHFSKRLQGLTFSSRQQFAAKTKGQTKLSSALAKGKFHRNTLQTSDGNQGPYRLSGANNETYFFVLANSEQVFVDGQKLERGADRDYLINYNAAEITFMPRKLITRDSRIQVEFEYADRNYLNTNLYLQQTVAQGKKLAVSFAFYQNRDAPNNPINQILTAGQKQFLQQLAATEGMAFYPSAYPDSVGTGKVLYERVVLPGPTADTIYRYTAGTSRQRYAVAFTDLGQGNGNYLPDQNGLNGKVYRYVPPVNSIKQGRFEPVQVMVPPKQHRVASLSAAYRWNDQNAIETELAWSHYNPNFFAPKSAKDIPATAARMYYRNQTRLGKGLQMESKVRAEYLAAAYKPVERLRSVEFSRAWGLPTFSKPMQERWLELVTTVQNRRDALFKYQYSLLQRGRDYAGMQQEVTHHGKLRNWQFTSGAQWTRFKSGANKGLYWHPQMEVQKTFFHDDGIQLLLRYEAEQSKTSTDAGDSLTRERFAYYSYGLTLRNSEKKLNRFAFSINSRTNSIPQQTISRQPDRSYTINLQADLYKNPNRQLNVQATYRQVQPMEKSSTQPAGHNLLARAAYQFREWNGLVSGSALYELGNGQEPKRERTYYEVPAGQGEYTWMDYNNDGLQQLNEFETARFRDHARYARLWIPTNEYLKTGFATWNYVLTVDPGMLEKALKSGALLTRFLLNSALQANTKTIANHYPAWNPFPKPGTDTSLISVNTHLTNNLSFNRQQPGWGLDLEQTQSQVRAFLNYGMETNRQEEWRLKGRTRITRILHFDLRLQAGNQKLMTPAFANRNYQVFHRHIEPRIALVRSTSFRLQGAYRYAQKKSKQQSGQEALKAQVMELDCRYSILQNSMLTSRISYHHISYDGPTNTSLAYTMLEGLMPGKNLVWQSDFTQRLANNIEINFSYEGRKAASAAMVHTGRASVRAVF